MGRNDLGREAQKFGFKPFRNRRSRFSVKQMKAWTMDAPFHDRALDITADLCPMTFVKTRLALDRMEKGQVLRVRLKGEEPRRNVPRTAREQGHEVLAEREEEGGACLLWLRKG
jgi:tRNA 2-thiouridine synthesizing protein A